MRFDNASSCEEVIWDMRITDEPRAADRSTILKLFNGNPPFDEATVEENNIQVNRNDLEGVNIIAQARRQWNNGFLKPSNFFTGRPDTGPAHKRMKWGLDWTRNANRLLKRDRTMLGQVRAEGAQTLLYGIGPSMWKNRSKPVPTVIPVGSLMVPSETEIEDFDNLSYFAVFREWTAAQLYDMTHGPRVDPGWNMALVNNQMDYIKDEMRKSPNSLAYQYMPERIEELIKQDKGYFGSDAVPTVDVWDFYFREAENGKGWYRRVLLDWGGGSPMASSSSRPASKNMVGEKSEFLYSSGSRKYADSLDQILFCQFGDCSAYAPFKYHSVRGLGWMIWGVCDLQNRLHCKFNEAVFEQLMWFFQTAGNQDLLRLKKANFEHMGIIPQGIRFLTPGERYVPNAGLIQMAFSRNKQLLAESSTMYTQDYEKNAGETARTATETMAIVNSAQALAGGIMELAYGYSTFKYREIMRRLCRKGNSDPMAKAFRTACLRDGIPEDMLDVDRWTIEPEQVVGGGNKTIQMATVAFLNQIRKNLPPNGQRIVDHISVEAATDQPDLAEEIAPMGEDKPISHSMHDAQLSTDRLLRGLPFTPPKDAVFEDYVIAWSHDLAMLIQKVMQRGGTITPEELAGLTNLGQHIGQFLGVMANNPDDQERVTQLSDQFGQLMNHVKALGQRLQQSMKAQMKGNGAGQQQGMADAAKAQSIMMQTQAKIQASQAKSKQTQESKDMAFQREQNRRDMEMASDMKREGIRTRHALLANRLKALGGE